MSDPGRNDPHTPDPTRPADPDLAGRPYADPAADPRIGQPYAEPSSGGRAGLVAAGIIAVLLIIALVAFSTGPGTDPGTTAVIPDQSEQAAPPQDAVPPASPPAAEAPAAETPAPEATPPAPAE